MIKKILSFFRKAMVFIFMTPFLKKIRKRSPKTYSFLARRFSLRKFSGMPLTLLCIAMLSNLVMLLDIYEDILNANAFIAIDTTVAEFVYGARIAPVAEFFYMLTQLGSQYTIISGVMLISFLFIVKKKSYRIPGLLVAAAGSALTVQLGKHIFKIQRPHEFAYYAMDSFSFPSGHSTAAVAFYGVVFYFLIRDSRTRIMKFAFLVTGLFLILAIGFSRIYLCEHYLSDVLGGYLLGLLWLLLSISILLWEEDKLKRLKK